MTQVQLNGNSYDLSSAVERVSYWSDFAAHHLVGRTIRSIRYLTKEECDALGWNSSSLVVGLDDGTLIYPSRDDEGNDAGAIFGQRKDGNDLTFPVLSRKDVRNV